MKPRKRITRRVPLPRPTKRIRAQKKDPSKRRFAKRRCPEFLAWLREQPCCITGKRTGEWMGSFTIHTWPFRGRVDPAHTRPRSLGADDLYECIPLSRHLHDEQERIGWPAFEKKYGIDRIALAKKYADEWLAAHPGGGPQ